MAESQERTGRIPQAIDTRREARRVGRAPGNQIFAVVVEMSLASALNEHGQRLEAVAVCQQAIDYYTDDAGRPSPLAALILMRLGMLHYEANQLELAQSCHALCSNSNNVLQSLTIKHCLTILPATQGE